MIYRLQGDVVGIYNANGVLVTEYAYDGRPIFFGGGFYVGTDHCYDPRYPYNDTVRATSTTYGNGKGVCFGYYYYGYWGSIPFWTE